MRSRHLSALRWVLGHPVRVPVRLEQYSWPCSPVPLAAGRAVFHSTHNGPVRLFLVLVFAAPAALAGYHVVLGIGRLTVPSDAWQHAFAGAGALIIGLTAAVRLSGAGHAGVFAPAWDKSEIS